MASQAADQWTRAPARPAMASASSAMRSSSASTQAAAHTASLAPTTAGRRMAWVWASTASTAWSRTGTGRPCRWGATATITSPRREGLLRGQPPARSQQLSGQLVEVDGGRPVGQPGGLDGGVEGGGRVAQRGQLGLPAEHQIPQRLIGFAVPGGPGRHRPGRIRGVRAHRGGDLGGAGGVDLAHLGRDTGDGPAAQPTRRALVRLDPIAQLDRLGRRGHTAHRGGGVQMVADEGGVEGFPAAPGVAHPHCVGDQHVIMDLRVAGPGGGVAGGSPDQPAR